ncbi:hypothetical protein [Pseudarthrobacter sp. PvP090]|uniref:hypothetical protein n=1 Tax=Pseudarthrobacter sp. PvP090 TaxID=3156393 RepID=UPI00339A7413
MESSNDTASRVFSDDGTEPGRSAEAAPRRRWPWVAGILAVAAVAAASGVLMAGTLASTPEPAGTAGGVVAPTASASLATEPGTAPSADPGVVPPGAPSTAPPPATDDTVAGPPAGRYVSASAGASFELPDGWTVEEPAARSADYPGSRIVVFNEARMQVAELFHGTAGGVGGACGPGPYTMTELDSAPALENQWATAAGVRFSYRVLDLRADGGAFDYQLGLVDRATGQLGGSCLMYSFVSGAPQGTLSFANRAAQGPAHDDPIFNSMDDAKEYMRTPEYRKLKAMILSLEVKD